MGVATTLKIIISSNTIGYVITVQPGNYKWVIAIKVINITK